ncbi:DUF1653 domain-containing protein [Pseudomonas sp. NW5]|uniref:DUF1653 domain-containing protein n=1 Tax=Pseudomonas sp. NW5 TaxID=2934934 RepID=UPI00201FF64A|nr:DUF1653 domain-containing protein [Pseudomonas sp. NW5]MCL7461665.1 DUF1653 domain-containing protein [Pseudomonas sp. NW5]
MTLQTGLYRHYKGGEYRVFGCARHSETGELLVIYQALYGEQGLWVRPLAMFCESVRVADTLQPRFALLRAEEGSLPLPGAGRPARSPA